MVIPLKDFTILLINNGVTGTRKQKLKTAGVFFAIAGWAWWEKYIHQFDYLVARLNRPHDGTYLLTHRPAGLLNSDETKNPKEPSVDADSSASVGTAITSGDGYYYTDCYETRVFYRELQDQHPYASDEEIQEDMLHRVGNAYLNTMWIQGQLFWWKVLHGEWEDPRGPPRNRPLNVGDNIGPFTVEHKSDSDLCFRWRSVWFGVEGRTWLDCKYSPVVNTKTDEVFHRPIEIHSGSAMWPFPQKHFYDPEATLLTRAFLSVHDYCSTVQLMHMYFKLTSDSVRYSKLFARRMALEEKQKQQFWRVGPQTEESKDIV